jgi:hypothetical protein
MDPPEGMQDTMIGSIQEFQNLNFAIPYETLHTAVSIFSLLLS